MLKNTLNRNVSENDRNLIFDHIHVWREKERLGEKDSGERDR